MNGFGTVSDRPPAAEIVSSEAYLRQVLARYPPATDALTVAALQSAIAPQIQVWAGQYLRGVTVSGSNAKGTAVGGQTDVDFFISIASDVPENLRQIYWSLYQRAQEAGWSPRARKVSIGVRVLGHSVDLVPARVHEGYINRHSLYRRMADTWTMTDVSRHIALMRNSGRREEVRLIKIWRQLHGIEFPSLALELAVLQATSGRRVGHVADNVWAVLGYLATTFASARLVDPSNTANVVTDDLTAAERRAIVSAATVSRSQTQWDRVVW